MSADGKSQKKQWIRFAKLGIRLAVLILVCIGIWGTVVKGIDKLQAEEFSVSQIHAVWLLPAAAAYVLGLMPCWWFWYRTLRAMGQRPGRFASFRAYSIGHLGKYVPGKAMVVVLRTGLIRGDHVNTTVAATSVFVETLTMMAVGAFVAAAILATRFHDQTWLVLLAAGLMVCAGVPTIPPIFRRLVRMVGVSKVDAGIDSALQGLDLRLMLYGWITVAAGWLLLGLSLWAVLHAIPTITAHPVSLADWPLATACVSLAMVAGFLSLLPGGIGIREAIVLALLAEPFGPAAAVVSAVILRLVWLLTELVLAAVLYLIRTDGVEQTT